MKGQKAQSWRTMLHTAAGGMTRRIAGYAGDSARAKRSATVISGSGGTVLVGWFRSAISALTVLCVSGPALQAVRVAITEMGRPTTGSDTERYPATPDRSVKLRVIRHLGTAC